MYGNYQRQWSIIILYVAIAGILGYTSLVQAAENEIGCCEIKNTPDDGTRVFEDKTETECRKIDLDHWDKFSIFHKDKQVSANKQGCTERSVTKQKSNDPIYFDPAVSIPQSDFVSGKEIEVQQSTITLANYIVAIFKYSTGVIGIIAAIALMMGGIIWLTAGGNHERVSSAKTMIGSSLIGMCLAFGAFLILSMVNTNLVHLKITPVQKIQHMDIGDNTKGCCKKFSNNPLGAFTTEYITSRACEALQKDVGDNDNQYHYIEFQAYKFAEENNCVPLGCCQIYFLDPDRGYYVYKHEVMTTKQCDSQDGTFSDLEDERVKKLGLFGNCLPE